MKKKIVLRSNPQKMSEVEGMLPIGRVARAVIKCLSEKLVETIDSADRSNNPDERRQLFQLACLSMRVQLVRLYVIVQWTTRSAVPVKLVVEALKQLSLSDIGFHKVLFGLFDSISLPRLDLSFFNVWDVATAAHILGSGSYLLLPQGILEWLAIPKKLPKGWLRRSTADLLGNFMSSGLEEELLLKYQMKNLKSLNVVLFDRVSGTVKLKGKGFTVHVWMRMAPPQDLNGNELTLVERINWRVSKVEVRLRSVDFPEIMLVDVQQEEYLKFVCNNILSKANIEQGSFFPLFKFLEAFSVEVKLHIFRQQILMLQQRNPGVEFFKVDYIPRESLSISYWLKNGKPAFTLGRQVDDKDGTVSLLLLHSLPQMQDYVKKIDIDSDIIDLLQLFDRVLVAHSKSLLESLYHRLNSSRKRVWTELSMTVVRQDKLSNQESDLLKLRLFADFHLFIFVEPQSGVYHVISDYSNQDAQPPSVSAKLKNLQYHLQNAMISFESSKALGSGTNTQSAFEFFLTLLESIRADMIVRYITELSSSCGYNALRSSVFPHSGLSMENVGRCIDIVEASNSNQPETALRVIVSSAHCPIKLSFFSVRNLRTKSPEFDELQVNELLYEKPSQEHMFTHGISLSSSDPHIIKEWQNFNASFLLETESFCILSPNGEVSWMDRVNTALDAVLETNLNPRTLRQIFGTSAPNSFGINLLL
jgi:hypothetical protein